MNELGAPMQARVALARARVQQVRDQTLRSMRFTRAILSATRTMLIGVGLIDPSKNPVRYIPFQLFWVGWWLLFAIGLILPTYPAEAFVVFPSVLALAIVWLLGMGQFAHTLLGQELRFIRVSPTGWTVFIGEFQKAGLDVPSELQTAQAATTASKELQISLPGLVRQSIVDFTSLAAVQALLAGAVAVIGLILGFTLGAGGGVGRQCRSSMRLRYRPASRWLPQASSRSSLRGSWPRSDSRTKSRRAQSERRLLPSRRFPATRLLKPRSPNAAARLVTFLRRRVHHHPSPTRRTRAESRKLSNALWPSLRSGFVPQPMQRCCRCGRLDQSLIVIVL